MSAPTQPLKDEVYTTPQNPASKRPGETHSHPAAGAVQEVRQASHPDTSDAVPSALGRGIHGAPPAAAAASTDDSRTDAPNKMQPPGEDHVASAAKGAKPGSGGEAPGLESDLDRKKAEQAPLREAIAGRREQDVDVGGVLGQRGGPANPVD